MGLFRKRLSHRMGVLLLTLCLVGLGQASPTSPSFITDLQIRALYGDVGLESLNYGKGRNSKNSIQLSKHFERNMLITVRKQNGKSSEIRLKAGSKAIDLKEKGPTDNKYCVTAKPFPATSGIYPARDELNIKIGCIQDLRVTVQRKKFNEAPFYNFAFRNKQDGGFKYQAHSGDDTVTITCKNIEPLCYGFLQPNTTIAKPLPIELSYEKGSTTSNKIVVR